MIKLAHYSNFVIIVFILIANGSCKNDKKNDKCDVCNKLVQKFIENLDKTSNGNFGGGNTDWEDRKLGSYLTSETRFEEIIENICDDSECYSTLEEYEDYLFDWFKNKQSPQMKFELKLEFCVNKLKYCCPKGKYGSECNLCPNNLNQTCSGNGNCDGDSTRKGSGRCNCYQGYIGELCDNCQSGFFLEIKNEKTIKCTECHKACRSTCLKAGPDGCVNCKDGWIFTDGKCEDVDECLQGTHNCGLNEFCQNIDGSFNCNKCDVSCLKCTSYGAENCVTCNSGFLKDENGKCVDINECEVNSNICEQHKCINKVGSFECEGNNSLANEKDGLNGTHDVIHKNLGDESTEYKNIDL